MGLALSLPCMTILGAKDSGDNIEVSVVCYQGREED